MGKKREEMGTVPAEGYFLESVMDEGTYWRDVILREFPEINPEFVARMTEPERLRWLGGLRATQEGLLQLAEIEERERLEKQAA